MCRTLTTRSGDFSLRSGLTISQVPVSSGPTGLNGRGLLRTFGPNPLTETVSETWGYNSGEGNDAVLALSVSPAGPIEATITVPTHTTLSNALPRSFAQTILAL